MRTGLLDENVPFGRPTGGSRSHPLVGHVSKGPEFQTSEMLLVVHVTNVIHSGQTRDSYHCIWYHL